MNFARQVSRMLDEEHRAQLALLAQVEQGVARSRRHDAALAPVLAALARALEHDVLRHFRFEEEELFTRLAAAGDTGIAHVLTEEHDVMREVGAELLPLLSDAQAASLDDARWETLRQLVIEIVERQVVHIQKETMALLPMLDDLLDEEVDGTLALAYASQ